MDLSMKSGFLWVALSIPVMAGVITSVSIESCGTSTQTGDLLAQTALSCFGGGAQAQSIAESLHLGISGSSTALTGAAATADASFTTALLVEGGPLQGFLDFSFSLTRSMTVISPSRLQVVTLSFAVGDFTDPFCTQSCTWAGRLPYVAGTPVVLSANLHGLAGGTRSAAAQWNGDFGGSVDLNRFMILDQAGTLSGDGQVHIIPEPGNLSVTAAAILAMALAAFRLTPPRAR